MASLVRGAPLAAGGSRSPARDPEFSACVQWSHSLTDKILLAIEETHRACIDITTLQFNSSDNAKFGVMAENIGIPSPPVLKVISDSFPLETSFKQMMEGFQMHQALLSSVLPHLKEQGRMTELLADTRDLLIQIRRMWKMVQPEADVQLTPPALELRLPGEYDVQVATHLTLVQLWSFSQDVVRCLRNIAQDDES